MNINFSKFFTPRGRIQTRVILFSDIFKDKKMTVDNDIVFAFSTSNENYPYASIRISTEDFHDSRY